MRNEESTTAVAIIIRRFFLILNKLVFLVHKYSRKEINPAKMAPLEVESSIEANNNAAEMRKLHLIVLDVCRSAKTSGNGKMTARNAAKCPGFEN